MMSRQVDLRQVETSQSEVATWVWAHEEEDLNCEVEEVMQAWLESLAMQHIK